MEHHPASLSSPLPPTLPPTLLPVRVSLEVLHEWPGNARTHGERNLAAIKNSLEDHGQVLPLVVQAGTNRIVGGNGTRAAMLELGWGQADVVFIEIDDVRGAALNAALNRTAELAAWDFHALGEQVRLLQAEGLDLERLGWNHYELEPLLAATWKPAPVDDDFSLPTPEDKGKGIHVSAEQREVIEQAIGVLRDRVGDDKLGQGRALEIICSEWMVHGETS